MQFLGQRTPPNKPGLRACGGREVYGGSPRLGQPSFKELMTQRA
ncbi:hypothetical protein DB31_8063 [Hyalangium minutum]|uniref:Uncharacterized protein n=1 Tax=Hyalangium minutum TaxID=394096 RepID=A0A085WIR7_9BACT|nr:hypothetical protein DB31_8063 [Hyalangium minutum]